MPRIRSIKPEYWTDLRLAHVSRDARLLYIALWNQADEWARAHADVRFIKGHCLPYDDDLSLRDISRLLDELEAAGRIKRYVVDGEPFLVLPKLGLHQRLEPQKVPSRIPAPPDMNSEVPQATPDLHVPPPSEPRADTFERCAAPSGTNGALQVASSREHVASSREHVDAQKPSAPRGRKTAPTDDPVFDEFWSTYPRRIAKIDARKAWVVALRNADAATILAGARRLRDDPTLVIKYAPYPASWLNDGRWDDEGPAQPPEQSKSERRTAGHIALVREFAQADGHLPAEPLALDAGWL